MNVTVVHPILVGSGGSPVYLANYGHIHKNTWTSGLFDCTRDMDSCLKGAFCICCLMAQNSANLDGNDPYCKWCFYPGEAFKNRMQAKSAFSIPFGCFDDCCTPLCCGPCSECQVAREIKAFKPVQDANPNTMVFTGMGGGPVYIPRKGAPRNNQWSTGLFDCCGDCLLCWYVSRWLVYAVAWDSYLLDGNRTCCVFVHHPSAWKNRVQAESLFGIQNKPCEDCLIAHCCPVCSEVQVHRHISAVKRAKAQAGLYIITDGDLFVTSGGPAQQIMVATYNPPPQGQVYVQYGGTGGAQIQTTGAPPAGYNPQQ